MANHGHKRDTNARRKTRLVIIAAPVSVLATLAVVGVGVLGADPGVPDIVSANQPTIANANAEAAPREPEQPSRSGPRAVELQRDQLRVSAQYSRSADRLATKKAVNGASTKLWTTEGLNLWDSPTDAATKTGAIEADKLVMGTGRKENGRVEIVVAGAARWVTASYLSDEKPVEPSAEETESETDTESEASSDSEESSPEAASTTSTATCSNGTSVPSGVSANIAKVHQAVCAQFPEITVYGTFRGDGEHAQGLAVDIMVSGSRGSQVAEYVRANSSSLGVNYLIYSQRIWSRDRGGEGWRGMSDRGSTTANHYDHVHVTTY